jgi:hypothetical protein
MRRYINIPWKLDTKRAFGIDEPLFLIIVSLLTGIDFMGVLVGSFASASSMILTHWRDDLRV